MKRTNYAILAVRRIAGCLGVSIVALLTAVGPLKEPLKIRFDLVNDVRIDGELSSWDFEGFDGTFGRRLWTQIRVDDLWSLHQRLMDPQSVEEWINLGRLLLTSTESEKRSKELAERAFRSARQLNEESSTAIQKARDDAAAIVQERREKEKAALAAQLNTISPEGHAWPTDPWPLLSDQEQKSAVLTMRADTDQILHQAGMALVPVETDHILLYTDLPRADAARWIMQLEKSFERVHQLLQLRDWKPGRATPEIRTDFRGFWGKLVVLVFQEQDRFALVEAESFKQLVPQATVAIGHFNGPKVFINAHRVDDHELFEWSLIREVVHGYMHRYRTPHRLPAWANEGLAEYVAALGLRETSLAGENRRRGLAFVRNEGFNTPASIDAILDFSYAEQTWPGPSTISGGAMGAIGPPIGSLMMELLLKDQPQRTVEWMIAVKDGTPWQDALREKLGVSRALFVERFVQYYKVND